MPSIQQQLDRFHRFATERIKRGASNLTITQLYDLWRTEHPSDAELAENVAGLKRALREYENGDRGLDADEHSRQLRHDFNLPRGE